MSGTASGELHFWDASTGQFIFAARTRHPNDAALSAMGSSEGTAQAYGSGAHGVGASDEGGGGGGQGGGGVAATFAATAASASAITAGNVNLMMYTACEEGYVKTWKVGEDDSGTRKKVLTKVPYKLRDETSPCRRGDHTWRAVYVVLSRIVRGWFKYLGMTFENLRSTLSEQLRQNGRKSTNFRR